MGAFTLDVQTQGKRLVLVTHGYVDDTAATKLIAAVDTHLGAGGNQVILDLTDSKVVASPGLAGILDICIKVVDDQQGRLVICGLDKMKENVFAMASIFQYAEKTQTLAEAAALLGAG